ncbi:hypothetical protein [Symmachiella dynata]|uniref:hypothetical protein n=1 Tax=Symmachiella dynata TaxID=2527995 RepID=UPI0030EC2384
MRVYSLAEVGDSDSSRNETGGRIMTEPEKRRSYAWVWWTIGLPLFYVLSIGPVARIEMELFVAGYDTSWMESIGSIFYWPIGYCALHNDTALRMVVGYFELWGIEMEI